MTWNGSSLLNIDYGNGVVSALEKVLLNYRHSVGRKFFFFKREFLLDVEL